MTQLVQPPYPMFSLNEMQRRHDRVRELMATKGLDALVISQEENLQYFVGTTSSMALNFSLTRPSVLIIPIKAPPVILTMGRGNLLASGFLKDIRGYRDLLDFPLTDLVGLFGELGLDHSAIGFELGHEQRMGIPVGGYLDLLKSLPGITPIDAGPLLHRLRMIKSGEEIACMRAAADITARARQRLFHHDKLRHGITERQVDRLMRQLILEEGGDRTAFVILQSPKPGAASPFKPDRPLERGDILAIDTGAYCGLLTIDYPRMVVLGKATDAQKKAYDAILFVNRKMTEALRPGIRCSELFAVCMDAIDQAGAKIDDPSRLTSGRMGHGMGMIITEPPSIMPSDHTILEPGMIISTEPGIRLGDVEFLYEDVHVITPEGSNRLTTESDQLHERPDF
ncbi:MAG: aminopeptidase P family protein [Phycisphaerales bacterium]|nr:aminopeptidase P family protein [Phycisphaerales bacterium]